MWVRWWVWLAACAAVSARRASSFAGLRNAGSTCYLNSVLQALYHVPPIREAALAAGPAQPRKRRRPRWLGGAPPDVPGALGAVFGRLDRNATGATRELTQALGVPVWEQQDAHEYLRLVLDQLSGAAAAAAESCGGGVRAAYEGALEAYLELTPEEADRVGEPYGRRRAEPFLDLSLEVAGHADLHAALEALVTPEKLEGDNRWKAGDHGPCEALKGTRLLRFPPVLLLHLKRFSYDPFRDAVVKMGQPLAFPTTLRGLAKYAAQGAPDPGDYALHAVLVHVGGGHAGHYFAYVDPRCDGNWVRFDDDRVTPVQVDVVLRDGLGRPLGPPGNSMGAYILQYVRKADADAILRR